MFACRGGLVEEEEGPRHSRVWEDEGRGRGRRRKHKKREEVEDEGRGGGRGKTWRTREDVEFEPLETSFNVTRLQRVPRHSDANQGACCPDSGHPANQQG